MQVDSAAPIPVPVQMRMPRLNMADACPTPAVSLSVTEPGRRSQFGQGDQHTELEFSGPHGLGRVHDELLRKVALNTADHVVVWGCAPLAVDAKGMVLHDGCPTNSSQETLLHAAIEPKDGNLG